MNPVCRFSWTEFTTILDIKGRQLSYAVEIYCSLDAGHGGEFHHSRYGTFPV